MNPSMINSSVSMQGLQQKLNVISNNMANVDTNGFKRKEASFHDVLTTTMRQQEEFQQPGRLSPSGFTQGWGAKLGQIRILMEQGALKETNLPYDLAIEGDALFEVGIPEADPDGQIVWKPAWTRDGSFSLVVQPEDTEHLYLANKAGYLVRNTDDEPVRIPNGYQFKVEPNGAVMAYSERDRSAPPVEAGRLKLVQIVRPQLLRELGDNLFALPEGIAADDGDVLRIIGANPEDPETARIAVRQGFLEQSNVKLADEMAELMMVQRAFQFNAKALASSDNLMALANTLRG